MLKFDGKEYRTSSDVLKQFKTSAKHLKKLVKENILLEPQVIRQGGRTFRYYDDAWVAAAKKHFDNVAKGK